MSASANANSLAVSNVESNSDSHRDHDTVFVSDTDCFSNLNAIAYDVFLCDAHALVDRDSVKHSDPDLFASAIAKHDAECLSIADPDRNGNPFAVIDWIWGPVTHADFDAEPEPSAHAVYNSLECGYAFPG